MEKDIKRVLVTGASRGIGKAVCSLLVSRGYSVTGTCREPSKLDTRDIVQGVEYHPLELTDKQSIDRLITNLGRIDILINNAGLSQIGASEEISPERIQYLFDLNFFGPVRLIQGLLPGMRAQGGGYIINLSSMAGRISVPFSSFYAATKRALEGFSRGLRNELFPMGIRVVILAPTYIKTDLPQERTLKEGSPYSERILQGQRIRNNQIAKGSSPDLVAEKILKILQKNSPAPYYPVGKGAFLQSFLAKHLPEKITDSIVRRRFS